MFKKVFFLLTSVFMFTSSLQASLKQSPVLDVAIVGAGMAGLTAGMHLAKKKVSYKIFEAKPHSGGRAHSITLPDGTVFNEGGEWIDQDHEHIIGLCNNLGVPLQQDYYDKGFHVIYKSVPQDTSAQYAVLQGIRKKLKATLRTIKEGESKTLKDTISNAGLTPIEMSFLSTYVEQESGKGPEVISGGIGAIKETIEGVKDFADIAGLHLKLQGQSKEIIQGAVVENKAFRFRVKGGMGVLIKALEARSTGKIEHNKALTGLSKAGGVFVLSFGAEVVKAKSVILTIPLGVLRGIQGFDAGSIGLTPNHTDFIKSLQYGTNSKVMVKSSVPVLYNYHLNLDQKAVIWENPKRDGLVVFLGGETGETLDQGSAQEFAKYAADSKALFEFKNWSKDPFALGSYSITTPGTKRLISTNLDRKEWIIADPVGGFKIAGEATVLDFGFLDSAVQSGGYAAEDILNFLKQTN